MRINLPESIICVDQTYILMYTDPNTGELVRKTDVGYQDFESKVISSSKLGREISRTIRATVSL